MENTPLENALKIRPLERIAFGLGDFGINMIWQMVTIYLLFFYTDVFGITAAVAGTIFLVNRVWDGVNDPLIGWLADRTRSKRGSYRPYLLFCSIPYAVMAVLSFSTPEFGMTGKIVYAFTTYFFLVIFFTLVTVPHGSLIPVMTRDLQNRSRLASMKSIGTMVAVLIVSGGGPALLSRFSDAQTAYFSTILVFSVIGVAALLFCYAFTRERYPLDQEEKIRLKDIFKTLKTNSPLLLIVFTVLLFFAGFMMRNSAMVHYFKYNIGNEGMIGIYFAAMSIFGIIGALLTPVIIKRIDKRNTALVGLGIYMLAGFFWFLAGNSLPVIVISSAASGLGIAISSVCFFSMGADTVDYGEWKTGKRASGIVNAVTLMSNKLGTAIGGALVGYTLTMVSYVPNINQTPETLGAIKGMVTILPSIICVVGMIVISFYKLDRKKFAEILSEVKEREDGKIAVHQ